MDRADEQKAAMYRLTSSLISDLQIEMPLLPNNGTFKSMCWTFACRLNIIIIKYPLIAYPLDLFTFFTAADTQALSVIKRKPVNIRPKWKQLTPAINIQNVAYCRESDDRYRINIIHIAL